MKILAIDSSGLVASVAVAEENKILAEFTVNNKKTHSQTLLPMIDTVLSILELDADDLDAVAVSKGPGSFTGLRIGSATAKGITLASGAPIVEVSSLEAMAFQITGTKGLICPMMDARREQVYTALFEETGAGFQRVTADEAMTVRELTEILNVRGREVIVLGDGVPVAEPVFREILRVPWKAAPAFAARQRAAALGMLALQYVKEGKTVSSDLHRPEYLRLSQAERERLEKENAGKRKMGDDGDR